MLAPHLLDLFETIAPLITVEVQQMWLPNLISDLSEGAIDVAITCGLIATGEEIASEELCAEELLVGLRAEHPLARGDSVSLGDLVDEVLGIGSERLFPAWVLSQRQALEAANVAPRTVELKDTDLAATRWLDQPEVDWVLLISSLRSGHTGTVVKPVRPAQHLPFILHWIPTRTRAPAVKRFVSTALAAASPSGWIAPAGRVA